MWLLELKEKSEIRISVTKKKQYQSKDKTHSALAVYQLPSLTFISLQFPTEKGLQRNTEAQKLSCGLHIARGYFKHLCAGNSGENTLNMFQQY